MPPKLLPPLKFAAFKNHLSYLPHSGSVFPLLKEELAGYRLSTGALQFPIDEPQTSDQGADVNTGRFSDTGSDLDGWLA